MTELLNPPLVTFALFAYNQEQFVREAIEGALRQTYEPLEIILSDDCSTDGTFEVMKEIANSYRGRHVVKAVQTKENEGVAAHVMSVARIMRGDLMVLAAGDDISKPSRVVDVVEAMVESGAWAVFSKFDRIDEHGNLGDLGVRLEMPDHEIRNFWPNGSQMTLVHGATSAYSRQVFELIDFSAPNVFAEDGVMCSALHAAGKRIFFIDKSLIYYRSHQNALSNSSTNVDKHLSFRDIVNSEKKVARHAQLQINYIDWLMALSFEFERKKILVNKPSFDVLEKYRHWYGFRANWIGKQSLLKRANGYFVFKGGGERRWILPRLFGLNVFAFSKFCSLMASRFCR